VFLFGQRDASTQARNTSATYDDGQVICHVEAFAE
jgi:hypothetical protein